MESIEVMRTLQFIELNPFEPTNSTSKNTGDCRRFRGFWQESAKRWYRKKSQIEAFEHTGDLLLLPGGIPMQHGGDEAADLVKGFLTQAR